MKKTLVTLLVLFPLLGVAGEDRRQAPGFVGHMADRLNLTEEQTQQMRDIFREHRQQMRALREATEQKVNALLTEEQRTAMQELKAERKEKRKEERRQEEKHKEGRRVREHERKHEHTQERQKHKQENPAAGDVGNAE